MPLPTPAPLPKTGNAPPPAAAPSASDSSSPLHFFPFSLLDKGASAQTTAFDGKQRALLDRISLYLSSVQTMVGNFVQVGPDGGRTEGTLHSEAGQGAI